MSMNPGGSGAEQADDGDASSNTTAHAGYPVPSDTYEPADQGTNWPADSFTGYVLSAGPGEFAANPARHSYDGDGNMEAYAIAGPYSTANEAETDLGLFTGATGPTGHVTSEAHPEITAP